MYKDMMMTAGSWPYLLSAFSKVLICYRSVSVRVVVANANDYGGKGDICLNCVHCATER